MHAVSLGGRERLVVRAPGILTLNDISRDGRLLLTADTAREGLMPLSPGDTKERDLSWLDWYLTGSPCGCPSIFQAYPLGAVLELGGRTDGVHTVQLRRTATSGRRRQRKRGGFRQATRWCV